MIITSRKNLHILCFGENSIHKEVRSRQQFLREIFNRNNVDVTKRQVLLLLHDCWIPYLCDCYLVDRLIHMDLPLSEELFLSRLSVLREDSLSSIHSIYSITSTQLDVLSLIHTKYNMELTEIPYDMNLVQEKKKQVKKYVDRYGEKETVCSEEIPLEKLTEEDAHQLFYQNPKAEIIHVKRIRINGKEEEEEGKEEEEKWSINKKLKQDTEEESDNECDQDKETKGYFGDIPLDEMDFTELDELVQTTETQAYTRTYTQEGIEMHEHTMENENEKENGRRTSPFYLNPSRSVNYQNVQSYSYNPHYPSNPPNQSGIGLWSSMGVNPEVASQSVFNPFINPIYSHTSSLPFVRIF